MQFFIKAAILTIDQVAGCLGISKDTVRRRIKQGKLQAERRQGPYGIQWMVPESEIHTAQEITHVVPVTRQVSIEALAETIPARVTQALVEEHTRTWGM